MIPHFTVKENWHADISVGSRVLRVYGFHQQLITGLGHSCDDVHSEWPPCCRSPHWCSVITLESFMTIIEKYFKRETRVQFTFLEHLESQSWSWKLNLNLLTLRQDSWKLISSEIFTTQSAVSCNCSDLNPLTHQYIWILFCGLMVYTRAGMILRHPLHRSITI